MAAADDLREILTTYPSGVYVIDCLVISYSGFGNVFLTMEKENTYLGGSFYSPAHFEVALNATKSDLDESYMFTISDIDNRLDDYLNMIPIDTTENVQVTYRAFNSDDTSLPAKEVELEAFSITQEKGVFTISAGYKSLAIRRTGVIQDYELFPMLKAII